jgi:hypothetical protein
MRRQKRPFQRHMEARGESGNPRVTHWPPRSRRRSFATLRPPVCCRTYRDCGHVGIYILVLFYVNGYLPDQVSRRRDPDVTHYMSMFAYKVASTFYGAGAARQRAVRRQRSIWRRCQQPLPAGAGRRQLARVQLCEPAPVDRICSSSRCRARVPAAREFGAVEDQTTTHAAQLRKQTARLGPRPVLRRRRPCTRGIEIFRDQTDKLGMFVPQSRSRPFSAPHPSAAASAARRSAELRRQVRRDIFPAAFVALSETGFATNAGRQHS